MAKTLVDLNISTQAYVLALQDLIIQNNFRANNYYKYIDHYSHLSSHLPC
jgi:hypothetical protein